MVPVVLLHGFMGKPTDWDVVTEAMVNWKAPTLPFHNGQDYSQTFDCFLSHFADLYVKNSRPIVVGYSLGGRIGLHLLRLFPRRIRGLILVGAHPGLVESRLREQRTEMDRLRLQNVHSKKQFTNWLHQWYSNPIWGNLPAEKRYPDMVKARCEHDPQRMAKGCLYFSSGRLPSCWGALEKAQLPVSYICGEQDQKYVAVGRKLGLKRPDVKIVSVPNVGHNVVLQSPETIIDEIAFMREVVSSSKSKPIQK